MSTHWLWSAQSWWRPASLVDSSSYLPTPPTPYSWPYQPVQWRFLPPANLGQQGRGWHGHSLLYEICPGADNHLALRPDLHMPVGTPGRRHSFFPWNLKSNKSRLKIFEYLAYHSVYYIQINSGKSVSWQPFPHSEGKGNKVKHSKTNNTKLQCASSRRSLELIRQL